MTEKEKYIGAFLDGYFHDKELDYDLLYFKIRDKAENTYTCIDVIDWVQIEVSDNQGRG